MFANIRHDLRTHRIAFKRVQINTGIELPCEVEIGRNFVIDHFGGIVISGYAKFGDNRPRRERA